MTEAFNKLIDKLIGWGESLILMLPNAALAIIVMVAFFFLGRLGKKIFSKTLSRVSDNKAVNKLMANILTLVVFSLGLFLALSVMDLDTVVTSLLAGAGVVGLALGLAFQDPILNVFSGIMISFHRPFKIGDMVESNGFSGTVQKIDLRSTTIKKFTGEDVIIPNKMVLQSPIENYTYTQFRRVDISCGVSYNDDLQEVKDVAIKAIEDKIPHFDEKPVELIFTGFGDSSIDFDLRFWLDMSEQKNYLDAKSEAIIVLKKAFDERGINIPFPIRTLEIGHEKVLDNLRNGSFMKASASAN